MVQKVDMLSTYYRKSNLPIGLQIDTDVELKSEVTEIIESIRNGTYHHQLILFSGLNRGKTLSAASCLREWLKTRREVITDELPGLFLPVHQLCYQNRTIDKRTRDPELQAVISKACSTDFLILDGIFSYVTQNDDLLLQAIYDARQYSGKTTLVTTSIVDPLDCAGSILFRIARDAQQKVVF